MIKIILKISKIFSKLFKKIITKFYKFIKNAKLKYQHKWKYEKLGQSVK